MKGTVNSILNNKTLYVLLSVLILTIAISLIVFPDYQAVENMKITVSENEMLADDTVTELENNKQLTSKIDEKKADISEKLKSFFPVISQEKIQLYLNSIAREAGVDKLSYNLTKTTEKNIDSFLSGMETVVVLPYDIIVNELSDAEPAVEAESDLASEMDAQEQKLDTLVRVMVVELSFESNYEALNKYLALLEKSTYKIVTLKLQTSVSPSSELLNVSLTLGFFSIPRPELSEADAEYMEWFSDSGIEIGRDNPFGAGSAVSPESVEGAADAEESFDFYMIVKPENSDSEAFTIGVVGDDSYYTTAGDGETVVELRISESSGRQYFTYTVNGTQFPESGAQEYTPSSAKAALNVISSFRTLDDDDNTIALSITNESSIPFRVVIDTDDEANPRVKVTKFGSVEIIRQ